MLKAFVDATPAADLEVARNRSIKSVGGQENQEQTLALQ